VVVVRDVDPESRAVAGAAAAWLPGAESLVVAAPGQVHALNRGLAAAKGDVVAITDDDAAPRPDWLSRVVAIFADAGVGGVGGRDWVHHGEQVEQGVSLTVGKLQWFGRCIGNHHLGAGVARDVDFLKGANMSYRRVAIEGLAFDDRLRGAGAQVCNDMAFSLAVRRRGWRLVYDPLVAVDHYPAERFDDDRRNQVSFAAHFNAAFNQALVVSETLGRLRSLAFFCWAIAVGTRSTPGLLQFPRLCVSGPVNAAKRTCAAIKGTVEGWQAALS
jgi:cellulose synthase/poly-beta-1,6-N-acetylglucosamine synthase-like glycosyltransferase